MNFLEFIAISYLIIFVPIPIGWIIIHLTVNFWRRLNIFSYLIFILYWITFGFIIFYFRKEIFSQRLNFNITLFIIGLILIFISFYLDKKRAEVFDLKKLIGLPEILPKKYKSKLVTSGIYSKIRHPRYLEYMLFSCGFAFITGFYYVYTSAVYIIIALYILILVEERELRERYGKPYLDYCKKVPRLFPIK